MFDLTGKQVVITGVGNDKSIATAAARSVHALGAKVVLLVQNEKIRDRFAVDIIKELNAQTLACIVTGKQIGRAHV